MDPIFSTIHRDAVPTQIPYVELLDFIGLILSSYVGYIMRNIRAVLLLSISLVRSQNLNILLMA